MSLQTSKNDHLSLINGQTGSLIRQDQIEGITSISSPSIDKSGKNIVFSGVGKEGFSDIFIYNLSTRDLIRITDDLYNDLTPRFLDNNTVLFTSDRCKGGKNGSSGIFKIDIKKKSLEILDLPIAEHQHVTISKDTKSILFSSDMGENGIRNIWHYDLETQNLRRVTNILTSVSEPDFLSDDSLVATVFTDASYQIGVFRMDTTYGDTLSAGFMPFERSPWSTGQPEVGGYDAKKQDYGSKLSFEIAQGAVSTTNSMESSGGLEGLFSDMLGNRKLYFFVYNPGEISEDFFRNFNIFAYYFDQGKRPGWGAGIYHYYYDAYNRFDGYYKDERAGVVGTTSYPFSRFTRIEASLYSYYYKRTFNLGTNGKEGSAISANLSLIRDNAFWAMTGPLEGMRTNMTTGITIDPEDGSNLSHLLSIDIRQYLRIGRRLSLAVRGIGRTSDGSFPDRFYMGGTWTMRGYPFYWFYGRNQALFNAELRFPLIDVIAIRTPLFGFNLGGIYGATFFDAGQCWEDSFERLDGSFGFSIKFSLGGYTALRFDISRTTDFTEIYDDWKLDFFFGWDY
jgi:hypothetical protein